MYEHIDVMTAEPDPVLIANTQQIGMFAVASVGFLFFFLFLQKDILQASRIYSPTLNAFVHRFQAVALPFTQLLPAYSWQILIESAKTPVRWQNLFIF
jgi:hypothetical protein